MTSLGDIGDELAREAYAFGENPLFYAEVQVTSCIEVHAAVTFHRAVDPGAFPGYLPALGNRPLASRILGLLLDLGWSDPRSAGDMDALARWALRRGVGPVRHAEKTVAAILKVHALIRDARAGNPAAFPCYPRDLGYGALARRILARLLDAGWTPPSFTPACRCDCPEEAR